MHIKVGVASRCKFSMHLFFSSHGISPQGGCVWQVFSDSYLQIFFTISYTNVPISELIYSLSEFDGAPFLSVLCLCWNFT